MKCDHENDPRIALNFPFGCVDTSVTQREHGFSREEDEMQRVTVSLVALQLVVACGYAVSAEDAKRPSYARTSVVPAPAPAVVAEAGKPGEDLTLRMTPRFVSAPGYLRSLIRVAPNPENRLMRVEIDSAGYYRSSEIQLDGASAPMSHFMDWKEVPAGKYDLTVTVIGQSGTRAVRHLNFQVLGPTSEP